MLVYEATRDAASEQIAVRTPVTDTMGSRLANPPLLVPVLRAGLGMVDQAHALIPEAQVGFVGMARDETTHQPTPYLASLPDDLSARSVFVLDPMLATGGSMAYTIELLRERNADDITAVCVVCAPQGIAAIEKVAPEMRLITATIDEGLNESCLHRPGTRGRGGPSVRPALRRCRQVGPGQHQCRRGGEHEHVHRQQVDERGVADGVVHGQRRQRARRRTRSATSTTPSARP